MTDRSTVWQRRALVAITCLPVVTAVVRALRHHWFPIGDDALLFIRVADVGTTHHPWLGSWTSASLSVGEHMNNPGPIYQDLIAVFAKLWSPGPAAAIGVGAANILTICAIGWTAFRLGGDLLHRWAMLATAALAWTMGSELLFDLWQAHALLLPFLLLLLLLIGVADGATWCLPWSLVVISLLVQTHISYAYVLAILFPVALSRFVVLRRRRAHAPLAEVLRRRSTMIWGGVLVLLWSQTVLEQLFGPGKGNLARLAGNAGGGDLQVGLRQAAGITAAVVALPPWWLRRGFSSSVPSTKVTGLPDQPRLEMAGLPSFAVAVLALAAVIAVLVVGYRVHRARSTHLVASACIVALAGAIGAVVAISRLTVGPVGFAAHHVRWVWPLAIAVHTVVAAVAVEAVRTRRTLRESTLRGLLGAFTVVLALATIPFQAHAEGPVADRHAMLALRRIFPELGSLRGVQPVWYDVANLRPFEPYSTAIMMDLQARGIEFRVTEEGMIRQLGEGRRADGSEPARLFQLQGEEAIRYDGPACRIAMASDLPPELEAEALAAYERGERTEVVRHLTDTVIGLFSEQDAPCP